MGLSREQISRLLESSVDLQGLQDPEDFFRGRSSTVGALGDHRTRQAAGQRPTLGLAWHIRSPERRLVPLIQPSREAPDMPDSVKAKETAALNSSLPKTLVPKLRPCYVNITEVKQKKSLHKENTNEKKEDTIYENDGLEEDSEQVSDDNTLDNEMMMRAARRQQGSEIEESWEAPDTPDCATDKRQVMVERYRDRLSSLLLSDTGVTVSLDEVARRLRFTSLADTPEQESREVRKTVRIKFQGNEQTKDKIQELGAYRREMKLKMKPMVARRQVGFRRRALQVSVGGSEEQVRAALGEGRSRQQLHAKARLASIRETGL